MKKEKLVILVHGLTNNPDDFNNWKEAFNIANIECETIPFEKKETIYKSIIEFAKALEEIINENSI